MKYQVLIFKEKKLTKNPFTFPSPLKDHSERPLEETYDSREATDSFMLQTLLRPLPSTTTTLLCVLPLCSIS